MARFKALLAESVRDPEATWAQSLPALQRDVQGRCVFGRGTVMDEFELRDEFLNHVAGLLRKVATDARVLMEETIKATCKEDFDVPEPPTPKDGGDDDEDDDEDEDDEVDDEEQQIKDMNEKHCRGAHLVSLYISTFLCTMRREWGNVDKHRVDKFYTAVRLMISEVS